MPAVNSSTPVDRDLVQPRQTRRQPLQQRVHAEGDGDQAGGRSHDGERDALGEQLADDPPASRADGGADGELALPADALRQQQPADVGAGDQQDQRGRPLEDLERGAQAADARLGQRLDADTPALVLRRFLAEGRGRAGWRFPAPVRA